MGATASTAFLQNAVISALPVYFGFCLVVLLVYQTLGRVASGFKVHPRPAHTQLHGTKTAIGRG